MRAVDRWVRAAFSSVFRGFELFPFRQRVLSHPPATNANRWAPREIQLVLFEGRVESLQLARTPRATYIRKENQVIFSTACASWRNSSWFARPHLLRMVSRVTRNHAGANASWNHVRGSKARYKIVAQQCVQADLVVRAAKKPPSRRKAFFRFVSWSTHQAANASR